MRTCVIFNPTAKGDKARHFLKRLDSLGHGAEFRATTHAGAARDLAKAAVEQGFEIIAAAGGDGTVNEVLNGICDAENGLQRARFAVIPLGTVNVFALEIGIPLSLSQAWKVIQNGRERLLDLPAATFRVGEKTVTRHFIQFAGAGWDARAVELVSWKLKKRIGRFAYVWAGLGALKKPESKVIVQAANDREGGDFVLVGNGRFYAGKYPFLYRASPADGALDVTVFPKVRWTSLCGIFLNFILGRFFRPGAQAYFQNNILELSSDTLTPLQLDGEIVGHLPATISIKPSALRVIVP